MEKRRVGMIINRNSGLQDLYIEGGENSGSCSFCQQNLPLLKPTNSSPSSGISSSQKPILVAFLSPPDLEHPFFKWPTALIYPCCHSP